MKHFTLFILLLLMASNANANDFFLDSALEDLRVFAVNDTDGIAGVMDKTGNKSEIYIGDTIGIEGGEVVEMDNASITVRLGDSYRKLRVFISNEEAEMNALKMDTAP